MSLATGSGVLAALAAALAAAAPAHSAADAPSAPRPAIEFVMPAAGAFIAAGPVVAAGRVVANAGFVNLLLDGVPLAEVSRGETLFSATFTPASGPHTLEARAGESSASLSFTYGAGAPQAVPYRYHPPVLEGRCAECHAGVRRKIMKAEAETCKSCHRRMALIYPYLHGPLAAGKCLVCHDPHGSAWPGLTVSDARTMCTSCHDQPGSLEHVEQARSKVCFLCHNPHASMNKKFLYEIVK